MNNFSIRPANTNDAAVIADIHERGWLVAYGHFLSADVLKDRSAEKRIALWQRQIADPAYVTLVGENRDSEAMGFVFGGEANPHHLTRGRIDDFDSELYSLHCRQEVHGKGLGRQLTAAFARHVQKQGAKSLFLWAYRDNNFRQFYDRLGGEIIAEGQDDGVADVAYGWRDIDALIAACEGTRTQA